MPAVVRPAILDDAESLALVAAVTFPLACPPGSTRADQDAFIAAHLSAERFAAYLTDPARTLFVALDDGTQHDTTPDPADGTADGPESAALGYTMLVTGEPTDADVRAALTIRPTVELSKCYVLPGHHGRGVAAALLTTTIDAARASGAAGIWLGVNQQNSRAQAFYARHGFARVGVKHFQVGDRLEDDYVLERPL